MNPAKSYAHLFSPLGGDAGENYRAPGQLTFLRARHVPLETEALKASGARYAFVGIPFDEGNIGKPGCEDGPREFRIASQEYMSYWFEFGVDLNGLAVDCGDVPMPKVNPEVARQKIFRAVKTALDAGVVPIVVGGTARSQSRRRALSPSTLGRARRWDASTSARISTLPRAGRVRPCSAPAPWPASPSFRISLPPMWLMSAHGTR